MSTRVRTHGAAVHVPTGELVQIRFGAGVNGPVAWLGSLPGPVRACYEAGPTGFGLYRAAVAAGIDMAVVAPGQDASGVRGSGQDRSQGRRAAGAVAAGRIAESDHGPSPQVEAARELVRAHDAVRRDLMTARHRVSKQLLRHGLVYPESWNWTTRHRAWLQRRTFAEPVSALAFADQLAAVDGLTAQGGAG